VKESAKGEHFTKYRSDWNMTLLDFERYDKLLELTDKLYIRVFSGEHKLIQEYYYGLKQIYRNFKPLLVLRDRKADRVFIRKFEELDIYNAEYRKIGKVKPQFFKLLDEVHTELLLAKQFIGIGIIMKREHSKASMLSRIMGITE